MESTLPHIPDLPPDKDFHLFVCYIRENLHDVHTIVANLERAGLRCCYHERDFTPGSSILTNVMETISRSLHMLVVLSEDFVNSPYAVHEMNEALHIRISEGYSIIPIKIEPCQVPDAMKHITWIDAENDDVNNMHHKIIDALLKTVKNGHSLSYKLVPFESSFGFDRYRLVLDNLDRQEILRNGFKTWTKMLEDLWVINKRARQLNLLVCYVVDKDVFKIMRYNFNPCLAKFIQRCERKEIMQRSRRDDETLNDYTVRLFDEFLESDVSRLFHPEPGLERHKMTNGARCICIQVEESLDLNKL